MNIRIIRYGVVFVIGVAILFVLAIGVPILILTLITGLTALHGATHAGSPFGIPAIICLVFSFVLSILYGLLRDLLVEMREALAHSAPAP